MPIIRTTLRRWRDHFDAFLRAIWDDPAPTTRTKGGR